MFSSNISVFVMADIKKVQIKNFEVFSYWFNKKNWFHHWLQDKQNLSYCWQWKGRVWEYPCAHHTEERIDTLYLGTGTAHTHTEDGEVVFQSTRCTVRTHTATSRFYIQVFLAIHTIKTSIFLYIKYLKTSLLN